MKNANSRGRHCGPPSALNAAKELEEVQTQNKPISCCCCRCYCRCCLSHWSCVRKRSSARQTSFLEWSKFAAESARATRESQRRSARAIPAHESKKITRNCNNKTWLRSRAMKTLVRTFSNVSKHTTIDFGQFGGCHEAYVTFKWRSGCGCGCVARNTHCDS